MGRWSNARTSAGNTTRGQLTSLSVSCQDGTNRRPFELLRLRRDGPRMSAIAWDDFAKVDIRVGRIVEAEDFPKARKPAYQLRIDFGELGVKSSSAQITRYYNKADLVGRLVLAVVNFPPTYTGALGSSKVPGSEMPMSACFDSPGPFTTHPITATRSVSTPG